MSQSWDFNYQQTKVFSQRYTMDYLRMDGKQYAS